MTALLDVYPRLPIELAAARGSLLLTADGREIADLYGGHAVCPLGHGHPELTEALTTAHRTLDFFSNSVSMPIQEEAARAVLGDSPHLGHVHFVSSGAEANESALHLARRFTGRETIVALSEGFSGRTLGALSVTGIAGYRKKLSVNAPSHWLRLIERDDPKAVDAVDETVAAVMIESIPSLAGIHVPDFAWLRALERRCREVGAMLIFDEVQGGIGRTGTWFFHEQVGVFPDIVTLAKSIGGGFPVGAAVVTPQLGAWVTASELGTTFGGGPMAAAMVKTVAHVVRRDGLMARTTQVFDRVAAGLADLPGVTVRGRGCLIGVQTPVPAKDVQVALLARDVLVGTSGQPHSLRLLPAYNIDMPLVDRFVDALREVLHA